MSTGSILLVGGPASGKTNYIARLWLSFKAKKGQLRASTLPANIEYVNDAVQHLLDRKFAPRTQRDMDESGRRDFIVKVRGNEGTGLEQEITVPDITGELWRRAIDSYELPQEWMDALKASSSAILFVRAHSKLNLQPMDWVTARDHLTEHSEEDDDDEGDDEYGEDEDEDGNPISISATTPINKTDVVAQPVNEQGANSHDISDVIEPGGSAQGDETEEVVLKANGLPAQVGFCELFRYLTLTLTDGPDGRRPRLAIMVTAWDMLDSEAKAAGPMRYLEEQFPMFAGRLKTPGHLDVEVFGMSIVGGNLRGTPNKPFRDSLKKRDLSEVGYTAVVRGGVVVEDPDVTLPLAWALGN
ncbi:TRAFAC clade GTPase domain-containing protein [Herbaspirillum hiltneri]|uniref:TRAFAC clade GTPase domain-containing protein n=1 Tax=Herbaspirillum hiltneri TaxID=341045 RepID=UPI00069D3601|nr:hypothetical protein [Herbaspirillum hiltneri]